MGRRQDFKNSVIYHIRHMESKEVVYVGSTTNFSQRKAKHKYLWNKEGKEFKYLFIVILGIMAGLITLK
jgi:predicted GIY-YIG superfamily endonuclease